VYRWVEGRPAPPADSERVRRRPFGVGIRSHPGLLVEGRSGECACLRRRGSQGIRGPNSRNTAERGRPRLSGPVACVSRQEGRGSRGGSSRPRARPGPGARLRGSEAGPDRRPRRGAGEGPRHPRAARIETWGHGRRAQAQPQPRSAAEQSALSEARGCREV